MPHHQSAGPANPVSQSELSQLIDQLSAVHFLKPDFNDEDIRQLGSEIIRKTQDAIASKAMLKWPKPSFTDGRTNIVNQFGLDDENHFFHTRPIEWASFHEPQITRGFAYFLNEDNEDGNGQRVKSFLHTFGIEGFDENPDFQVEAEAPAGNGKRVDLQILWKSAGNTTDALIIEAKFGHIITNDQLKSYEQYAFKIPGINKDKLGFFVLSPGTKSQHSRTVEENGKWKEISWFKVLLSYQHCLPASADNKEFRQFRRTVWQRACR